MLTRASTRRAARINRWFDARRPAYNTIAEIPGTDLKDQIVMLGGHLDSWHSGTGATDNAAGVAAAMEAVRILKTLGAPPRRTVRVALWSGEEQGLFGSKAYVAKHFGYYTNVVSGSAAVWSPKDNAESINKSSATNSAPVRKLIRQSEYEKLAAYFNLDNGGGKIRGVYLQGNEAVRPRFRRWPIAARPRAGCRPAPRRSPPDPVASGGAPGSRPRLRVRSGGGLLPPNPRCPRGACDQCESG